MTGIERLRTLAAARDEWGLGETLADIAEQIERERDAEVADSPYDAILHTKPEPPDSWERVEEDARGLDSGVDRELFTHTHEDIVRRCRALAERERGE